MFLYYFQVFPQFQINVMLSRLQANKTNNETDYCLTTISDVFELSLAMLFI